MLKQQSLTFAAVVLTLLSWQLRAQEGGHHHHHGMHADPDIMAMNENSDTLPDDCEAISTDIEFTVHAGTDYTKTFPHNIFDMNKHEYQVPTYSRVKVTFVNEDQVRHQ